jgi:hypothetical protein
MVVERCSEAVGIAKVTNGALEDSYPVPMPSPARCLTLSGFKFDRRILWKPPDLEKLKQHSIYVIKLRNNGMSRIDSPRFEAALMLFNSLLDFLPLLSGLEPSRKLRRKPFDVEMEQCSVYIVRPRDGGMSRCYSPRPRTALTPFASEPAVMLRAPLLHLGPPLSGLEPDGRLRWKPPKLKESERHSIDVIRLRDNGTSRLCSPGFEMALTPVMPEPMMTLRALPYHTTLCTSRLTTVGSFPTFVGPEGHTRWAAKAAC